ncbi:MAG TPA: glycoside hydrolase family 3 protein [Steroidobacteraceae bacterium]|nr:glycoside hydrolase family 3 protein [Steroidobacteraceae bacterium]
MRRTSRRLKPFLAVSALLVALAAPLAVAQTVPATPAAAWPKTVAIPADPALEERIRQLLARMTLEQKVAQMVQPDIRSVTPADVRRYHLGSILNGGGAFPANEKHATIADWVKLADEFYDASMAPGEGAVAIPIFWGTDAVHGHNNVIGATLFPHNIGLGAARDPDLMEKIGAATAQEVAATGIDWAFAPTVAVVRDDHWGRTYEGYSEDPELVSAYAGRMVRGLQGAAGTPAFLDGTHVLATAKHYIGDGGTKAGVDRGDNVADEQLLLDIHGQGYVSALNAGVQTVMVSYNSWQGWKMHGHQYLITEVLKKRMGFDGLVVSDWNGIDEVQGCSKDSCAAAVKAGIDLFMVPEDWQRFLANTIGQVKSGDIPQERIDDAVARILRVKIRAGLFDKGRPSTRPLANKNGIVGAADHRELARQAVRESLVLLKNGGVLPLKPRARVLVAGDGADNIGKQAGGWTISWQGTGNANADFPGATSIYAGIRAAVTAAGGTAELAPDGSHTRRPDVAIVVFGENPYAEYEGNVKALSLPNGSADLALLRKLKKAGIPVVAVLINGRPMWVKEHIDAADAFVVAWLPGTEGAGIADVLFRNPAGAVRFDFRGKLSFSWPKDGSQAPLNVHDDGYDPLFPFGFGLAYAERGSR